MGCAPPPSRQRRRAGGEVSLNFLRAQARPAYQLSATRYERGGPDPARPDPRGRNGSPDRGLGQPAASAPALASTTPRPRAEPRWASRSWPGPLIAPCSPPGSPATAARCGERLAPVLHDHRPQAPDGALGLAMTRATALERKTRPTLARTAQRLRCPAPGRRHRGAAASTGHGTIAAGHRPRHRRPHRRGEPHGPRVRPGQTWPFTPSRVAQARRPRTATQTGEALDLAPCAVGGQAHPGEP